jgi:1,5-anhydro-D-fructose reductase (1,5-anhydro-D-mannitol-forming)
MIRWGIFSFEPIVLENASGSHVYINERPEHVQFNLIEKIVLALNGESASPSTGITGARTSRIMDKVVAEYYNRKK